MTIDLSTILQTWEFRPLVLVGLLTAVFLYWRGRRLAPLPPDQNHPALFGASLLALAVAWLSPLHELASQLFAMRVLQHLLIISLFTMLFMTSNALPVLVRGLPLGWGARLAQDPALRQRLTRLTPKGAMWFLFVATVWVWYDPTLHMATVTRPWLRTIELTTLLIAASLHWWHITGAQPRLHPKLPFFPHMGYTMAGALPLKVPGLLLLFSVSVVYTYPAVFLFGLEIDPLLQQRAGGALIWLFGGIVYSFTGLRYFSHWLSIEEAKPPQPTSLWDNEEAMLAPGIDK
ncbi:MAG: cytochrome c oxidase assembly protein [Anaerolineales bacterium]|nr:cytochrome c oxidase assembly protein [Anaerolineales bacterium]